MEDKGGGDAGAGFVVQGALSAVLVVLSAVQGQSAGVVVVAAQHVNVTNDEN